MKSVEILNTDLENVDLGDDTIIEYKSSLWGRCWELLHGCPLISCYSSSAEVIVIDEDIVVIDYKSRISECRGHTWEWLNNNRLVVGIVAAVASGLCICPLIGGLIYGSSLGAGVAFSEAVLSQTYFGETDVASSAFGQYVMTPLLGFGLLLASITLCVGSIALGCVGCLRNNDAY